MSASITLGNIFNENFLNDSEQDANSVLTELDKGLRSTRIGVQCEAIVRFPRLFEKYPFPILINSSFLKLAEFFWNGSNLLRFWVLRVCQQSENQLDKILNIDAFVKRIFMVIHSNDPIARAITLRTLGAISRVIPEKQQVHHAIRRALDSHDQVEVEAAIYASSQFAAQSRSFAISMCTKISDMIESLLVPLPMKLQLIPVLRHMHHDANTAFMVRDLCLNLLPKYPAADFVIAILDSLTELSSRTLTGVPDQVNLLLTMLGADTRQPVRAQILRSLTKLAEQRCVHAWPKPAVHDLINIAKDCANPREQYLFLRIIVNLSECPLSCHMLLENQHDGLLDMCALCMGQSNFATAGQALAILAALVYYARQDNGNNADVTKIRDASRIIDLHMESLLLCSVVLEGGTRDVRHILAQGIRIASVDLNFATNLVSMITGILGDEEFSCPEANSVLCNALGALSSNFQLQKFIGKETDEDEETSMQVDTLNVDLIIKQNPVTEHLPIFLDKLNKIVEGNNLTTQRNELQAIEMLSSVSLQTLIGCVLPTEVRETLERCCRRVNCWTAYRIARSANRYGQHGLATSIYTQIIRHTVVDKLQFFLTSLQRMSQAECLLGAISDDSTTQNTTTTMPLMHRLEKAINLYWQALASIRASSSPANPFTFQLEYLKLRAQFLQALHMAVTVKNAQIIVPPPAIAGSLAQNSRDYLHKFGHVTNQLRKLVKSLKSCQESYIRLYKSAFDADEATLEFLEIAEYQCALLAHIVEGVCYATPSDAPALLANCKHPETRYFATSCQRMSVVQKNLPEEPSNAKTISNRHLEVIMAEIEVIIKMPLCVPRFFFQILQSTQIKLSVSPQPRNPGESMIVQPGSNLVIKVEGVIQQYGKKRSMFRTMDAVQLSLTSQLMARGAEVPGKIQPNESQTLVQIVKPQRDFLTGSFLLPISNGGQWQVTLETHVVDDNGITWCTGPKTSMMVRVLEDTVKTLPTSSTQTGQTRRF